MASVGISDGPGHPRKPLSPDLTERVLAALTTLVLLMLLAALWRGRAHWGEMPPLVWVHIWTVGIALALTPFIMLRRRGDRLHRRLGWVWASALFATGIVTLFIHGVNGGFSFIHLFSVMTLVGVPGLILTARSHKPERHRSIVRGLVIGGLVIAGLMTFPGDRLLGTWLFRT